MADLLVVAVIAAVFGAVGLALGMLLAPLVARLASGEPASDAEAGRDEDDGGDGDRRDREADRGAVVRRGPR